MGELVAIISGVVGLIAIATFLISYGVWRGRIERTVEQQEARLNRFESLHRELGGEVAHTREEMAETRGKLPSFTKETDR